jgi:hypothetical protein
VILDTEGNIFGGFTPVEWESRRCNLRLGKCDNRFKADHSLRSFIFTLKNPHSIPARIFPLNLDKKERGIGCSSFWGPCFCEICIGDNCNTSRFNSAQFKGSDDVYRNDSDVAVVFTRKAPFRVKDIEVFEITDDLL